MLITRNITGISFNQIFLWTLIALLSLFSSGCSIKLVADYDPVIDKTVTELQQSTAAFFTKMKTASDADRTYDKNKAFYADAKAVVSSLILRSKIIEQDLKKTSLTDNFVSLDKLYDELEKEHKNNPSKIYFKSSEAAFDQAFRAIIKHMVFLKWNKS